MKNFVPRRQSHLHVPADGGGGGSPPDDGSEYVITDIDDTDVTTNASSWVYTDSSAPDLNVYLKTLGGDTIQDIALEDVITEDLPLGAPSYLLTNSSDNIGNLSGDLVVWE